MTIKIVLGNKEGKSVQKELTDDQSAMLIGKKIGEKISGDDIGLEGYEFEITGGSDTSGTPMRKDAEGIGKKKVLTVFGVGVKKQKKGQKQRKTVCGNTVSANTSQVNMKALKIGKVQIFVEKAAEGKEAKPEDKK